MTAQDFDRAIFRFVQILRDLAPKDTGNLAYFAIRYEKTGEHSYKIYVHTEGEHTPGRMDGIAPYQVYLDQGQGKHRGWWQAAVELALEEVANLLKGSVENGGKI